MRKTNGVRIFGIPMDLGQNRRGVDMGPSAVRYAGLGERITNLGYAVHDMGNISVPQAEENTTPTSEAEAHHLPQVAAVCQRVYEAITSQWQDDEFGLFIGGDHSISIGTVAAAANQADVGLVWVDAHADMNTSQTSPSGNIHGMSAAVLLGDGSQTLVNVGTDGAKLQPEQVTMVGVRSIDGQERARVHQRGLTVYTMRDVDEQGISAVAQQILSQFATRERLHISFDLDSIDPRHAPGVGTPVMGGLSYREAHLLLEILADSGKACSMDVVEINPILDSGNRTAELAVEMVLSLLGKQIL